MPFMSTETDTESGNKVYTTLAGALMVILVGYGVLNLVFGFMR